MARFNYEQSSKLGISAEKGEIERQPEPDTIAGVDVVLGDGYEEIQDGHVLQWSARSGNFEITDISTDANSIPWSNIEDIPFNEAGGVPKLEAGPKLPEGLLPDDFGVSTTDRCFAINSDEAVHVKLCEEDGHLRVRGEDDEEFRDIYVGDVIANQVTGEQFIELSSIKFKENVEPFSKGLEIADSLRPVQYNFLPNGEDDVGLIAEEVEEIYPDLVAEDEDGNKGIKYSKLSVVLLNALQQTRNEISELKDEVAELRDLVEREHT